MLKIMVYDSNHNGTDIVEAADGKRMHGLPIALEDRYKYLFLRRVGDILQEFVDEGDNMFVKYAHYMED